MEALQQWAGPLCEGIPDALHVLWHSAVLEPVCQGRKKKVEAADEHAPTYCELNKVRPAALMETLVKFVE